MEPGSAAAPVTTVAASGEIESLDISGAVATGIKWKVITQVVSESSRVIVTLVLACLLSPSQYGVAGMAMVCVSLAAMFTDPALGTALVQRREITEEDCSTVFWTTCAIGTVLAAVGVAGSGLVADLFGQPEVQKLFVVLSIGLFVAGISVTQLALLTRNLDYRSTEIREIFSTLIAAGCALVVAFSGYGPWAIIANWLVFTCVSALLVWFMSAWRPRLIFSRASLGDLGGFGLRLFGARFLGWGDSNMDNVLVGRYLGASALGAYALAYNVMYVPITRISLPLASVFAPAYARMQHDPRRLMAAWLRSKRLISTLLSPAFVVAIVVAPDLIHVVFGQKWHAAVVPIQLLSLAGLAQSLVGLNASILTALKRADTLLRVGAIVSFVTIAGFVAGLPFGIVGVAGFYAAARWLLVPVDTWMTVRAINFKFWRALQAGAEILPLAASAGLCGYGAQLLLDHGHVPALARLVLVSSLIVASYTALLRMMLPDTLREIAAAIRRAGH